MNGNLRVGSLFGIPFYVNASWFLVLGLITWDYGSQLSYVFPSLGAIAWGLGLVAALLLFASVVAHELGHSLVALRQGIEVNSITLFLFGGLAMLKQESKTPGQAFWVAIAGPLVSFVLAGLFIGVNRFSGVTGATAAILGLLGYINLMLALFNLLPGLPLDGGNILKAIVWKITGKPYQGLAFASRAGQFLGWAGIGIGVLSVLGLSQIGNPWTILVGWFLLQNADRSAQAASVQQKLSGLTAADAVLPKGPIVSAELSLREFVNNYVIGNEANWQKYLVTDEAGVLVGELPVEALKAIPTNDWWDVQVKQVMQSVEGLVTIEASKPLIEVVNVLEENRLPALVVMGEGGTLVGLLEKASIIELLQKREASAA